MFVFYIILRAKGWESSKDISSATIQCARFAARLTLGLLNVYVLNITSFTIIKYYLGGGFSVSGAFQFC